MSEALPERGFRWRDVGVRLQSRWRHGRVAADGARAHPRPARPEWASLGTQGDAGERRGGAVGGAGGGAWLPDVRHAEALRRHHARHAGPLDLLARQSPVQPGLHQVQNPRDCAALLLEEPVDRVNQGRCSSWPTSRRSCRWRLWPFRTGSSGGRQRAREARRGWAIGHSMSFGFGLTRFT